MLGGQARRQAAARVGHCRGSGVTSAELVCDRDVAKHGVAQRSARTAVVVDVDRDHRLDWADPRARRAEALEARQHRA
jgi:hypothetical protein